MGETYVDLILHGPSGARTVTCLADTAATFTKVPREAIEAIGLQAIHETPVELGDGRVITRRLALAEVQIENVRRPVLVALAENGEQPLCGYTTLETLGFKVDTIAHRLERRTPIEY